ncbi:hypothetical protein MRX96_042164 [Rhipicephalus microplus]
MIAWSAARRDQRNKAKSACFIPEHAWMRGVLTPASRQSYQPALAAERAGTNEAASSCRHRRCCGKRRFEALWTGAASLVYAVKKRIYIETSVKGCEAFLSGWPSFFPAPNSSFPFTLFIFFSRFYRYFCVLEHRK